MISDVTHDGLMSDAPRCPQWWQVFMVRGSTGQYAVYADDVVLGIMRCTCPASSLRRREPPCKHIRRVVSHGCFAAPDRAPGPNDLSAFNVSVLPCDHPVPRLTRRVRQRCACGEPMQAPKLRLDDDAGHQIVRVVVDNGGTEYAYVWAGKTPLSTGDTVIIEQPGYLRGTVIGFGSDWADTFSSIREKVR